MIERQHDRDRNAFQNEVLEAVWEGSRGVREWFSRKAFQGLRRIDNSKKHRSKIEKYEGSHPNIEFSSVLMDLGSHLGGIMAPKSKQKRIGIRIVEKKSE